MTELKTQPNLIRQFNHKFRPNISHEHSAQSNGDRHPNEQSFSGLV